MSRFRSLQALAVVLLAACSSLDGTGKSADGIKSVRVGLRVRDSETGLPVASATVASRSLTSGLSAPDALMDRSGRGAQEMESGGSLLEVSAAGYATLRARLAASSTEDVHIFWLDPLDPPPSRSLMALAAARQPGMALLHGHVLDEATGLPLAGATLELAKSGLTTQTDEAGYFALQLSGSRAWTPDDVPSTEDLLVRADGFVSDRLQHVALFDSDVHFVVDLKPGLGQVEHDFGHKLVSGSLEAPQETPAEEESTLGVSTFALNTTALYFMDPIDSITVTGFGTMSLESYVGNGIGNEWIASWAADSLKAGTVAYRSYGASYQISSGSICATSSCQVFKNNGTAAGKAAAKATSGIMLSSKGTSVARSEYSAENNCSKCTTYSCSNTDLSCGSGHAGSPATGWSCLDDAHSFSSGPGACCFGHGRGMCQWGTSAWAKASKNWAWMVNHYYNDEGKGTGKRILTMTSPIEVTQASVSPASVSPGGSVDVSAILRSYAEDDHPAILLRTSIVPGSGASIANPNGVGQLTASGTGGAAHKDTSATQKFAVGTSVAAGAYDLLVEVILDANGSKTVDAVDILLASKTVAHALTVGAVTPVDAGSSGGSKDSGVRPDATVKADADGLEQDPDSGEAGSDSGVAPDAHGAARDSGSGTPTSPPASCGCSTPGASMEWLLALALLLPGLRRPGRASRARS